LKKEFTLFCGRTFYNSEVKCHWQKEKPRDRQGALEQTHKQEKRTGLSTGNSAFGFGEKQK
jgi:hypothetical protein